MEDTGGAYNPSGNRAISTMETSGFASPPHDGFAFVTELLVQSFTSAGQKDFFSLFLGGRVKSKKNPSYFAQLRCLGYNLRSLSIHQAACGGFSFALEMDIDPLHRVCRGAASSVPSVFLDAWAG
jgi:hypothetical protein